MRGSVSLGRNGSDEMAQTATHANDVISINDYSAPSTRGRCRYVPVAVVDGGQRRTNHGRTNFQINVSQPNPIANPTITSLGQ